MTMAMASLLRRVWRMKVMVFVLLLQQQAARSHCFGHTGNSVAAGSAAAFAVPQQGRKRQQQQPQRQPQEFRRQQTQQEPQQQPLVPAKLPASLASIILQDNLTSANDWDRWMMLQTMSHSNSHTTSTNSSSSSQQLVWQADDDEEVDHQKDNDGFDTDEFDLDEVSDETQDNNDDNDDDQESNNDCGKISSTSTTSNPKQNNQSSSSSSSFYDAKFLLRQLTSYEQVQFIQFLSSSCNSNHQTVVAAGRRRGASVAIERFVTCLANQPTVHVYNAALLAVAEGSGSHNHNQSQIVLSLLDHMDDQFRRRRRRYQKLYHPTPLTLEAAFRAAAADGTDTDTDTKHSELLLLRQLQSRFHREYPHLLYTNRVCQAAMTACGRLVGGGGGTRIVSDNNNKNSNNDRGRSSKQYHHHKNTNNNAQQQQQQAAAAELAFSFLQGLVDYHSHHKLNQHQNQKRERDDKNQVNNNYKKQKHNQQHQEQQWDAVITPRTLAVFFHVCASAEQVNLALSLLDTGSYAGDNTGTDWIDRYGITAWKSPLVWLALLQVCAASSSSSLSSKLSSSSSSTSSISDHRLKKSMRGQQQGPLLPTPDEYAYFVLRRFTKVEKTIELQPNIRHYTEYIKCLIKAHKVERALAFLDYLSDSSSSAAASPPHVEESVSDKSNDSFDGFPRVPLDLVAIKTVMYACNFKQARELMDRMKRGDFAGSGGGGRSSQLLLLPDYQTYQILLSACDDPKDAKAIVQEMHLSRRHRRGAVPPNNVIYTLAIAVCRKVADVESALYLLKRAQDQDGIIPPDVYMYSAAIWTAAQAGDCDCAKRLMEEMKRKSENYHQSNCVPNVVSYNGLMAAYTNSHTQSCSSLVDDILAVYLEMVEEQGIRPTLSTFQQLSKVVRLLDDAEDRLDLLVRVFDTMTPEEYNVRVGGPILESMILTFGGLGMFEEAKYIFELINGPADAACLRAILLACSIASPPEWEDALSFLHSSDIVTGTKGPNFIDQVALTHAMIACSKANKWEESFSLLQLYGNNRTSVAAVNSLIGACGRAGRPDKAMEILNEMEYYGIHPDSRSYRNAIISCNQAQHYLKHCEELQQRRQQQNTETYSNRRQSASFEWWECSLSLLRRMKEEGLEPDTQTYSSVISSCEAAGEWQRALKILQGMLDSSNESQALNLYCFNAAISACEKGGAWVEALEVYERMKASNSKMLQPTIITLSSLILAVDKAGQKELAQSLYQEGMKRKIVNPWRMTLRQNDGSPVAAMDLHSFSAAMARAAVRYHINSLLTSRSSTNQISQDWTIIVGKGRRSVDEPILLPTVYRLLRYEFEIKELQIDPTNNGRIIVPKHALADFVQRKRWR